jgi:hypothetical protein
MRVDGGDHAAVGSGNRLLEGLFLGLFEEDGEEGGAVNDDQGALRSSMISRGERGSRTGIRAMSSTA